MDNKYVLDHKCCPVCGSNKIDRTLKLYEGDSDNSEAQCNDCKWTGIVHELTPEKDYGTSLLDSILAKKEAREKLEEEQKQKKLSEATRDETDPRNWPTETVVNYIIWIFQHKSPVEVEDIMNGVLDVLKG